ncbi:MAG: DUF1826 domain-containing protein [Bacteroidota bacterium]
MHIFETASLQALPSFPRRPDQLAIVKREMPDGADAFFQQLMQTPFGVIGQVFKESARDDIQYILEGDIPAALQADPFYVHWLADMAAVCSVFADTLGLESTGFYLGTERGCRRYHIDSVPLRALVTYAGKGTEYLPDEAADRQAYADGKPNEEILKDPTAIRFVDPWNVVVFRGGPNGLLHRTPDAALSGPSILLRLDHPKFWEKMLTTQQKEEAWLSKEVQPTITSIYLPD